MPDTGSTQAIWLRTALTPGMFSAATMAASRWCAARTMPHKSTTPSRTVALSGGDHGCFANSAISWSRIAASVRVSDGMSVEAVARACSRFARLTIPTTFPLRTTGNRLMRRASIRCTTSSSEVSSVMVTGLCVITSATFRLWVWIYSSARRPGPIRNSDQRGRRRSVPVSARRKQSPSVTIPTR